VHILHTHTAAANSRQIPDRERKNKRVRMFQNSDLIGKGMILQENKIKLQNIFHRKFRIREM